MHPTPPHLWAALQPAPPMQQGIQTLWHGRPVAHCMLVHQAVNWCQWVELDGPVMLTVDCGSRKCLTDSGLIFGQAFHDEEPKKVFGACSGFAWFLQEQAGV